MKTIQRHILISIMAIIAASGLFRCQEATRSNANDPRSGDFTVRASVNPISGSTINARDSITVTFSDPMDVQSLSLAGDFTGAGSAWSSTVYSNDTLVLSPAAGSAWGVGSGKSLVLACNSIYGPGIAGMSLTYTVTYTVTATPNIAHGSTVTGHEIIKIIFGDSMNRNSCAIGGTMGSAMAAGNLSWSTTNTGKTDDTLTITPAAGNIFPKGSSQTLDMTCSSIYGPQTSVNLSYTVEYAVYVNSSASTINTGNAANPGTKSAPLGAIQLGIDRAQALYGSGNGAVVRVGGEGSFTYSSGTGPVITMKNGISVYGGYSGDFSIRNISTYITTVEDTRTSGGTSGDPNRAVDCPDTITDSANTVLDGFTIKLGGGISNAGIFSKGSATIRYNIIRGKTSTTATITDAFGIYLSAGTSIMSNNDIDPGYGKGGSDFTYGLWDAGTDSLVSYNTIAGGYGNISRGINSSGDGSKTLTIDHNTIDCGGGANPIGIYLDGSSRTKIDYNELTKVNTVTQMVGISESSASADPVSLTNNFFNFSTITANHYYYFDDGSELVGNADWSTIFVSTLTEDHPLSYSTWGNTKK